MMKSCVEHINLLNKTRCPFLASLSKREYCAAVAPENWLEAVIAESDTVAMRGG